METIEETPVETPRTEAIERASLPSRVLAGLIDYFFVTALFVVLSAFVREPDFAGLVTLVASMIYFSLGNSALTRGQSFGKRAFGLRVCALDGGLLTMPRALVRFFAWLGVIIICSELPAQLFRYLALRAEPMLLEAPMLFVMSYFIGNMAVMVFDPLHRGLHDRVARSIVLRTGALRYEPGSETVANIRSLLDSTAAKSRTTLLALTGGAMIGALLWALGVESSPGVAAVSRSRYVLEHELPIRFSALQEAGGTITLDLLIFDAAPGQGKKIAPRILELLQQTGPVPGDTLLIRFYGDPSKRPADAPEGPEEVSLSIKEPTAP